MKKMDFGKLLRVFGGPALMGLLGLILLVNPDSASALIAKLIGWLLVIVCGIYLLSMVQSGQQGLKLMGAVTGAALGIWLLCNPLVLASALGRFAGFLLLYRGIKDIWEYRELYQKHTSRKIPVVGIVSAVLGTALFFLPLSASRLVVSVIGLVLLGIAVAEVYDRVKIRKLLKEGNRPNIIDALE